MNNVWTRERRNAAREAAGAFAGTPHMPLLCLPGVGVDCVHFVAAILSAAGIIPMPRLPAYDERLGRLRSRNIIEDILLRHLHSEPVEASAEPEFGDVVICTVGRQTNHVGIILGGAFWHVPARGAVGPEALPNWRGRIQRFVRITGTGFKEDPENLTAASILRFAPEPATD